MSRLPNLGQNFCNLELLLSEYDIDIDEAPKRLSLKGKTIEEANKEQVAWPNVYDQSRVELDVLCKYLATNVEKVRCEQFRKYTDNSSVALSDRAKDKYVDGDKDFLDANALYLQAYEVCEKYKAIIDAFRTRGFALRQIGEARAHQFNTALL